jgi:hypothetical protein
MPVKLRREDKIYCNRLTKTGQSCHIAKKACCCFAETNSGDGSATRIVGTMKPNTIAKVTVDAWTGLILSNSALAAGFEDAALVAKGDFHRYKAQ